MTTTTQWLPYLSGKIISPSRSNNICSYSIALEAWRRGLLVKVYDGGFNHYTITQSKERSLMGRFPITLNRRSFDLNRSLIKKTSIKTINICRNKDLAKRYLSKANVPVPRGKRFGPKTSNEVVVEYAKSIGFPIVLKPNNSTLGIGVYINIRNETELEEKLTYLRDVEKRKDVLIEEHIEGDEYRIFVINNTVAGAVKRIPANVVGNGRDTIKVLIDQKNQKRKDNPYLYRRPVVIDTDVLQNIGKKDYDIDSTPEKGELIYLREMPSLLNGGDSVEATDEISDDVRKIAIKAKNAIPGLMCTGLDIIVPRLEGSPSVVLELNFRFQIGSILFPVKGQARDIPSAMIDYLFPSSKINKDKNRNLYFNIKSTLRPLKDGSVSEVTISPAPRGKVKVRRYKITGLVQGCGFRRWVQREALKHNISGYTKYLSTGDLLIVAAGQKKDIHVLKELCSQGPPGAKVEKIVEKKWSKPVMCGFRIIK